MRNQPQALYPLSEHGTVHRAPYLISHTPLNCSTTLISMASPSHETLKNVMIAKKRKAAAKTAKAREEAKENKKTTEREKRKSLQSQLEESIRDIDREEKDNNISDIDNMDELDPKKLAEVWCKFQRLNIRMLIMKEKWRRGRDL